MLRCNNTTKTNIRAITFCGRRAWILCLLCSLAFSGFGQSGWVKQQGDYFAQISIAGYQSGQYFNLNEEESTTNKFHQYNLYGYGEYGLTDHLTILANIPLLRTQGFETSENIWGIGDLRADLRYGFLQKTLPISVSVGVEAPLAKPNRLAANEDGINNINLPTGDGEWNYWATLAVSGSLHPLPAYVNVSTAYNKRTSFGGQQFKDQWNAKAEVGYQFFHKLWLQLQLGVLQSIGKPTGGVSFVRGDGTNFTQYSIGLNYEVTQQWGLGLQYYNNADWLISRANVYESPTLGFSVFFQKK